MSAHFSSTVTVIRYTSASFFFQEVSTTVLVTEKHSPPQKPDCFDALLNRGPSDLDIIRHTILKLANKSPTLFIESDSEDESWGSYSDEESSYSSDSSDESSDSSEDLSKSKENDK